MRIISSYQNRVWAFFAILCAVVILIRVPFLSQPFMGEEGSFAYLIAGTPASSQLTKDGLPQMMVGMLGDIPALYHFQRTILPYVLLENGPGTIIRALDVEQYAPEKRYMIVRGAYLSLYFIGVIGLLWRSAEQAANKNHMPMVVACFACTMPLAVGASIQPQIDGALGVCLLGLASLLLTLNPQKWLLRQRCYAAVVAGALIGMGRHEWAQAFVGGGLFLALTMVLCGARRSDYSKALRLGGCFCLGLAATVTLSFILSPSEYLSGFAVQQRVTGIVSPLVLLKRDANLVLSVLLLLLPLLWAIIIRRHLLVQTAPGILVIAGAAFVQFAGAATTGWPGDGFPRYYAPVFALAATALVYLFSQPTEASTRANPWSRRILSSALLLLILVSAEDQLDDASDRVSISTNRGASLAAREQQYDAAAANWQQDPETAPLIMIGAGVWGAYPDLSFLGEDLGQNDGYEYLKALHPEWANRLQR